MASIIKRRSVHSGRLERWLGRDGIERAEAAMLNACGYGKRWYGPPIYCIDLPGNIWIGSDGDFVGTFDRGYFGSALDSIADWSKRAWREVGQQAYQPYAAAGFASISDALARASAGQIQFVNGNILKNGPAGTQYFSSSLWRVGSAPAAGGAASAAPGGRACDDTTTGACVYINPSSGTNHLTGADMSCSVINHTLLMYDRIFDVAKTMASTATEAVTGVPTRYQGTTAGAANSAEGNFLSIQVGATALAATAHNWTTCLYTDQSGNTGVTLPSVTGSASAIADRFDMPSYSWAAPLATGDTGIQALGQMQCSASVATGLIDFVIGHPIGFMFFPVIAGTLPFDWLTSKDQAPRIFDDACLTFAEIIKPATTACSYVGKIHVTNAAP